MQKTVGSVTGNLPIREASAARSSQKQSLPTNKPHNRKKLAARPLIEQLSEKQAEYTEFASFHTNHTGTVPARSS